MKQADLSPNLPIKRTPKFEFLDDMNHVVPTRHPQTGGVAEWWSDSMATSEMIIGQTRFGSAEELETTLTHYLATYHQSISQRALNHSLPVQALKQWQVKRPEPLNKRVYELTGLDR